MMRRLLIAALAAAAAGSLWADEAADAAARKAAEKAAAEKRAEERRANIRQREEEVRALERLLNEKRQARDRKRGELRELVGYVRESSNEVARQTRAITDISRNLAHVTTNSIPHHERRVAEIGMELKGIEATARKNDRALQVQKIDNAAEAQRKVREQIKILRELLATEEPEQVKIAPETHVDNELVTTDASRMEIVESYNLARQLENQIIESFKDLKATETAISKKMSYESAQQLTDVPKPVRLEANAAALQDTVRTKEQLDIQKEEQVKVVREAETMVDATVEMMKEAMQIVMREEDAPHDEELSKSIRWLTEEDFLKREKPEEKQQRLQEMQEQVNYQVQLTEAAAENEEERAKDIAALMQGIQTTEEQHSSQPKRMPPPLKPEDLDLLPGNKIATRATTDGAPSARWMYVNDWYVIGPFPNPNRENLRRKFPPESVVDLNATYAGKNGETVSWKFMQAESTILDKRTRAHIVPRSGAEYVIWYAYAEVFFDEECDRWIAIGSDDRSDLWINNYPVWGSSNKLKTWNLTEGFRRCHFRKGRNELLIRVENGWHYCDWSVCIALSDEERGGGQ